MSGTGADARRAGTAAATGNDRWAVLEPLDTLVVRDGRLFQAGASSMARTTEPSPATIGGAVGQALRARPGQVHGPLLVRRREQADGGPDRWEPMFPVPTDVVSAPVTEGSGPEAEASVPESKASVPVTDGSVPEAKASASGATRLSVLRPGEPAPRAENPTEPYTDLPADLALLEGDGLPVGGWWDAATLGDYLTGRPATPAPAAAWTPWTTENRVGLARDPVARTAHDGMLYSLPHLRVTDGVGLAAYCQDLPPGCISRAEPGRSAGTVQLGGEGRRAEVHWLPAEALTLPPPPRLDSATPNAAADDTAEDTDGRPRLLVYLATPALFTDGWRPSPQEIGPGLTLVAASVVGPRVITTARPDLVTGAVSNGRLLWAAPAGSVYYLRADDRRAAAELIRTCHGRLLTAGTPFPQIDDELVTAGFGLALIGRW